MKAKLLIPFLAIFAVQSSGAFAGVGGEDAEVPPTDNGVELQAELDAMYQRDEAKIQAYLQRLRTDPEFAGIETTIKFHGVTYTVSRLGEAAAAADAKLPLPKAAAAALALANGLGAKTQGQLRIRVTVREYDSNGNIKSDTIYEIDAGGSAEISSGKAEADDKNHK